MNSFVRAVVPAAVCLLMWAGAPASAAPAPAVGGKAVALPFPAKAQLVVQMNGLERGRDRLAKLLTAALPNEAPKVAKEIDEGFKTLLKDRKTTAIPRDGRWFVVVRDLGALGEEDTPVAVLIPVTDAKSFRESFLTAGEQKSFEKGEGGVASVKMKIKDDEKTIYLVDMTGYVAASPSKATAESYAEKFAKASAEGLGASVAEALLAADFSLYVNMDAVNDQYGAQIRTFKQFADLAMQQAPGAGISKKQIEAAKVMIGGLFQGVEDARAFVLGIEFRPDGLAVRLQGRFADDSDTGKLLRNEKARPLADMGKLPQGLAMYSAGQVGKSLQQVFRTLQSQGGIVEQDEKTVEVMKKYREALQAAELEGQVSGGSFPDTALIVARYKHPTRAAEATIEMFKSLAAGAVYENVVLKEKPAVEEAAHKSPGGFTFNAVRTTLDFEATVKDLPDNIKEATLASMKQWAKEKNTTFFGTDGKVLMTIAAKDWDQAQKLLAEYQEGKAIIADAPSFKTTRQNLPAETTVLGIVDAGQMVMMITKFAKSMAEAIPGFPAQIPDLKPPKGEPSYVGGCLTLKPETFQVDVFVPATAFQVVRKMIAPLIQNVE